MAEEFSRIRDWVEPAHPGVIKLHEDLVSIYAHIRDHFQAKIDEAFDGVARQIGFVVTTTVPLDLEINAEGQVAGLKFGENLAGTLFAKAVASALNPQPLPPRAEKWKVAPGAYHIYAIWYAALKLKLRTDWMEPAHIGREKLLAHVRPGFARLKPEVMEPVHWFDPAVTLPIEEGVLIHAIDEVFTDLKLLDRVMSARQALRKIGPEVMEPAHLRPEVREPAHPTLTTIRDIVAGAGTVTARPEVREPAHLRPGEAAISPADVLKQIADVLRKAGF